MRLKQTVLSVFTAGLLVAAGSAAFAQADPNGTKTGNGSGMHGVGAGADPVTPGAAAPMMDNDASMKPMKSKMTMKKHKKKMMHKKKM